MNRSSRPAVADGTVASRSGLRGAWRRLRWLFAHTHDARVPF